MDVKAGWCVKLLAFALIYGGYVKVLLLLLLLF